MKTVRHLRSLLRQIPGVLVPFEPERASQGDLDAAKELWTPDRGRTPGVALLDTVDPEASDPDASEQEEGSSAPAAAEELLEFAPPTERDVVAGLGGVAGPGDILRAKLKSAGVDGLAWYVSFHQDAVQWGIYLPISGIAFAAQEAFGSLRCDFGTKFRLAFRLLHQHELFHFAADYAAAQLELLSCSPVWVPTRTRLRGPAGYNVLEEKLANAWMLRSLWRGNTSLKVKGRSEAARKFVRRMPEGYRDAPEVTQRDRFISGVDSLVADYSGASGAFNDGEPDNNPFIPEFDGARLVPFDPYLDWRQCPIHVIHDERRLNLPPIELDLLRRVQAINETEDFLKELRRLDPRIQKAWPKTKDKILTDITLPGLDFKPFIDGDERVYSVRLNNSFRAHLRALDPQAGSLEAFRVGSHKAMGHG